MKDSWFYIQLELAWTERDVTVSLSVCEIPQRVSASYRQKHAQQALTCAATSPEVVTAFALRSEDDTMPRSR